MPPDPAYPFLSPSPAAYPSYVDQATGRMLQAQPGQSYRIAPVNPGLPVPPADGRWGEPPAPVKAKAAKTPEGGADA